MFTTPVRAVLCVTALSVGVWQASTGDSSGLWLVAASAVLLYGHFRYGPVWLAFRALQRGNLDRATRLLGQVRRPTALSSQQRAYFELASGLIAASRGADAAAVDHIRASLDRGLRTENDRSLAEVELARLLCKRGERAEAREVLARARRRRSRPEVAAQAQRVQDLLDSQP